MFKPGRFKVYIWASVIILLGLYGTVKANGTVIATIPLRAASGVAVNPVTGLIYVGAYVDGVEGVIVLDGTTFTILDTIPMSTTPHTLAINVITNRIYVPDQLTNHVIVIDGTDQSVLTTIATGEIPYDVAVNPMTNRIYVVELLGGNVDVIDGNTNTIIDHIDFGRQLSEIAVNPFTNRIYVTDDTQYSILVMDGEDHSIITSIPVGVALQSNANEIAVNVYTNQVYLSFPHAETHVGDVIQIDGETNTVVDSIFLEDSPNGIAVNHINNRIYVPTAGLYYPDGKVYIIDGNNNTIVDTIPLGKTPYNIDADPFTGRAYTATYDGSSVFGMPEIAKVVAASDGKADFGIFTLLNSMFNLTLAQGRTNNTLTVIQDIRPRIAVPQQNLFIISTPLLSWNRVSWAISYEIEVDNDTNFGSPEYHNDQLNNDQFSVQTTALEDGVYYWRVRGRRSDGGWGSWTAVQRFVVDVP